jgi:hypothetical protein
MWRGMAGRLGFVALVACAACGREVGPEWRNGSPPSVESDVAFFPPGSLDDREDLDSFLNKWYSKHLSAAGEFALLGATLDEVYRFTYLPSFRHPVLVRVQWDSDSAVVVVKELDGYGGYDPGELIVERYRSLTQSEWNGIVQVVHNMEFWSLPKHVCEDQGPLHPDDGSVWLLEGLSNGRYAAVQWHSNECRLCEILIELAGLTLDRRDESLPLPPLPPPPPSLLKLLFR